MFEDLHATRESTLPRIAVAGTALRVKAFLAEHPTLRRAPVVLFDYALTDQRGDGVYDSYAALVAANSKLAAVLLLADDPEALARARRELPANVGVMDEPAGRAMLRLMGSEADRLRCALDLSQAQNLFAAVFDEVEEDILLLDADGVVVDVNASLCRRKNLAKTDIVGKNCASLEGRRFCCESKNAPCPYKQALRDGVKAENVHSFVDESGRLRYFRVYAYPIFNKEKELVGVMEMRRDITSRTNMELRLQQSEKMAAIGELATYIAHEIRNPLFAVGGFANSLLRSPTLDPAGREKAQIILEESRRLDKILKSILDFARPTRGRESTADLNRVVQESMSLFDIGFQNTRIKTAIELEAPLPLVQGDPELIKQCLINLVKNAAEAMPAGGELSVATKSALKYVRLVVSDTGPGVPDELLGRCSTSFSRPRIKARGLGSP